MNLDHTGHQLFQPLLQQYCFRDRGHGHTIAARLEPQFLNMIEAAYCLSHFSVLPVPWVRPLAKTCSSHFDSQNSLVNAPTQSSTYIKRHPDHAVTMSVFPRKWCFHFGGYFPVHRISLSLSSCARFFLVASPESILYLVNQGPNLHACMSFSFQSSDKFSTWPFLSTYD
jgi:hypothetical protein